jgi:DNA-binding HxlR family transcriptional regulator
LKAHTVDDSLIEDKFEELFEKNLRPLKSKNARIIYKIFVETKEVNFLTTLDLQTKLEELGISLSKKEINGWLRSLHDADLITKEENRGKPTTLDYDDKYTFDMWRLTPEGDEIAVGIDHLVKRRNTNNMFLSENMIDEIVSLDRDIRQQNFSKTRKIDIKLRFLKILWENRKTLALEEIREKLTPDFVLKEIISSYLSQGLIVENDTGGRFLKLLVLLGLSRKQHATFRLTEKGREFAERLRSLR